MAYTAPSTLTTGTLITASIWNTSITDNWAASWVGTTAGDMDYYTAATTKSRLALGTDGYGLFAGASAPAWSPGMKIIHCDTSDSAAVQTTDCTSDFTVFQYILPANTLGTNGMLSVHGGITLSTAGAIAMDLRLAFGSSNSSDGAYIGQTTSDGSAITMFDVDIIAKGASSQLLVSRGVTGSPNTDVFGSIEKSMANSRATTIDTTSDNAINIMCGTNISAVTGTYTQNYLYIYSIPYYTT